MRFSIASLAILGALPATLAGDVLTYGSPESVGMLAQPLKDMEANLTAYTRFVNGTRPLEPGSATLVARHGTIVTAFAVGKRTLYASSNGTLLPPAKRECATLDTVYDMASLTKLFTATAVLREVDAGRINLNQTVVHYLPEFAPNGKDNITVIQLLTHTSGLTPLPVPELWLPPYSGLEDRYWNGVMGSSLQAAPGTKFIYSDIGYMTLRFLLERVTGTPFELLIYSFTVPLGMTSTFFNRGNLEGPLFNPLYRRTAPTEFELEVQGPLEPQRPQPVRGTVHDENTWALGGVSGHAGLFSTVLDAAVWAQMIANNGTYGGRRYLSQDAVDLIFTDFNAKFPGSNYGVGFALNQSISAGPMMSLQTASHTGFTGTSVAIDRPSGTIFLHFSNRVHASRKWPANTPVRRAVGYWVAKSLGRDVAWPNPV